MRKYLLSLLVVIPVLGLLALGCAKPQQAPLPIGNLSIGVAHFSNPTSNAEMLAGYLSDDTAAVDSKILERLDRDFAGILRDKSKKTYTAFSADSKTCSATIAEAQNEPRAAIRRWSQVGRCMGVDLLLIPQVYQWQSREGGGAGVVKPARIVMDFFIIDVRNESLVSRAHFDETQQALTSNLLEAGKFFKRSGRWVTAYELAQEGMVEAIKDLRL